MQKQNVSSSKKRNKNQNKAKKNKMLEYIFFFASIFSTIATVWWNLAAFV